MEVFYKKGNIFGKVRFSSVEKKEDLLSSESPTKVKSFNNQLEKK